MKHLLAPWLVLAVLGATAAAANPQLFRAKERYAANGPVARVYTYYYLERGGKKERVLHGPDLTYSRTGKKQRGVIWKHGKRDGQFKEWYADGESLRRVGQFAADEAHGAWTLWYQDGAKAAEQVFDDGRKTGTWRAWHRNGQLSLEGDYRNDRKHGVHRRYHEDGTLVEETHWRDGQQHGPHRRWNDAGQLLARDDWREGKREGEQTAWFPSGQRKGRSQWLDGQKHGVEEIWSEDGTLVSRTGWKEGKKDGEQVIHGANSQPRSQYTWQQDRLHGAFVSYWPDGKPKVRGHYRDGKLHGPYEVFSRQGARLSAGAYVDDTEFAGSFVSDPDKTGGVYEVYYYDQGRFLRSEAWRDGKMLDGEFVTRYDNGQVKSRTVYDQGVANGQEETWFEDGQLQSRSHWRGNLLHGLHSQWWEDGARRGETEYAQGKRHGRHHTWFGNGKPCIQTSYHEGQRHGEYLEHYANGVRHIRCHYRMDKLHGPYQSWDHQGNLISDGEYRDGEPWHGTIVTPGFEANQLFVVRYDQGRVMDGILYEDDQPMTGVVTVTTPGGVRIRQIEFVDGKRNGVEVRWYENGEVQYQCHWRDNQLHGEYRAWFDNSANMWTTYLENGKRQGREMHWHPNGNLLASGEWRQGKPWDGTFLMRRGQRTVVDVFENGILRKPEIAREVEDNRPEGARDVPDALDHRRD